MSYLIDTNILIWYSLDDSRLPEKFVNIISNPENDIWISITSLWEITIKNAKGDLIQEYDLKEFFNINIFQQNINILPIKPEHLYVLKNIPFHHKDPFDRIIFAQSVSEKMEFL
jgi:PIN domain nuclease of toxin-antitoxin system